MATHLWIFLLALALPVRLRFHVHELIAGSRIRTRTAVAELLQTLSKEAGTQFICTTFRPEIVNVADKCYGVTFRNKSSAIGCYDTEDALEFVEGQAPR